MPLFLGGAGGSVGFVFGILIFNHPLKDEILKFWSKL
jgi:hypothetical protein